MTLNELEQIISLANTALKNAVQPKFVEKDQTWVLDCGDWYFADAMIKTREQK